MKFNEGDLVRVKNRGGLWRVSSVIDRPPLAYVREVDGPGKGHMNIEKLERTDTMWQAGEHLSRCKRYVEQRANGQHMYSFQVSRPDWMEHRDCGCGGLCKTSTNKQLSIFE